MRTKRGRAESVIWKDATGNVWLFGGYGYDQAGTEGLLNDLWEYAGGEWTWVSGKIAFTASGGNAGSAERA